MAKGDPNSKSAKKKQERLAMQRKMDARVAIVKTANLQDDPLASLPSFKVPWSSTYVFWSLIYQRFLNNFFFTFTKKEI